MLSIWLSSWQSSYLFGYHHPIVLADSAIMLPASAWQDDGHQQSHQKHDLFISPSHHPGWQDDKPQTKMTSSYLSLSSCLMY